MTSRAEGLLTTLAAHPSLVQVQDEFVSRPLGDNRELILGAYSALVHAEKVNAGKNKTKDQAKSDNWHKGK